MPLQTRKTKDLKSDHQSAFEAASVLKVLGQQGRLTIVAHLIEGDKTVRQLQALMQAPQPLVSSHLARLRFEGIIISRSSGQHKVYTLTDNNVRQILSLVNDMFCDGPGKIGQDMNKQGESN